MIEDVVFKIACPIAEQHNCEVVDVEYKKEGSDWFLRVFIDKEGGIFISDCESVSRALSDALDSADPINRQYILEVSSPGVERVLKTEKDFQRFKGHKIQLKLFKPLNNTKKLVGVLEGYHNNIISIRPDNGELICIDRKDVSKVNLKVDFF